LAAEETSRAEAEAPCALTEAINTKVAATARAIEFALEQQMQTL
jgi:hypothetical protein